MAMKIVILGAGSIGFQLAKQLVSEGKDVVVLEKNPAIQRYANERLDCKVEVAVGTDLDSLKASGLSEADFFVALTDSDEVNLASSYIVGAQYPKVSKIIRIRNLEYKSISVIESSLAGPSAIVHPPRETAEAIIKTIEHGAVGEIYEFANGEIQLRSFVLQEQGEILGQSLEQLRKDSAIPFLIPLLRRDGKLEVPQAKTELQAKDTIYIAAEQNHLAKIIEEFKLGVQNLRKRVVILGGGEIAITVGRLLNPANEQEATGKFGKSGKPGRQSGFFQKMAKFLRKTVSLQPYKIKYIERDYERCKIIQTRLPEATVINADVTEENLFEEEELDKAHIFIAATDNQELNIVVALFAKKTGIRRAIVLVRTRQMHDVAASLGLDVIVSTSNTMVNSIMRRIHGDNVHNIQSLIDGEMEILELQVAEDSQAIDKALNEINLTEKQSIVTYIYRNEGTILPKGSTIFQQDDRVILITTKDNRESLMEIFIGKGNKGGKAASKADPKKA